MTSPWTVIIILGIVLQVLVCDELLRGRHYRNYPLLFAYSLFLLINTLVNAATYFEIKGRWSIATMKYYWIGDTILQALIYILVISLINRALKGSPKRNVVRIRLVLAAVLIALVSFYVFYDRHPGRWMTVVSRNLSFVAALFNLILWFTLLRIENRDHTLLLITGGLGIQTAGEAIAQSLKQISPQFVTGGHLMAAFANIACLAVWWTAFRRARGVTDIIEKR